MAELEREGPVFGGASVEGDPMSRLDRTVWPLVLGLIFVVGACSASEDGGVSETSSESTSATTASDPPSPEIVALIEDYLASWEDQDEAALRASVSDGFVINEYIYSAERGT